MTGCVAPTARGLDGKPLEQCIKGVTISRFSHGLGGHPLNRFSQ
jgi:hypothetical protein